MRSEHRLTWEEQDAVTGWRKVMFWKPGERKAIKTRSHRIDRRAARRAIALTPKDET